MHKTTYNAKAYSAASATSPLASTKIKRRDPTEHDVQIEILFCGICHSDLHSVRNEWSEFMATNYPIVPGHEIVGRVTKVGSAVTKGQKDGVVILSALGHIAANVINAQPADALTETETDDHFRIIRQLRESGVGVVHISHRLEELKRSSNRVTVMRAGQYIANV